MSVTLARPAIASPAPRLRVGGLRLPARHVQPGTPVRVDRFAALYERVVERWNWGDANAAAGRPPVALRAGGLPLPQKTVKRAVVAEPGDAFPAPEAMAFVEEIDAGSLVVAD